MKNPYTLPKLERILKLCRSSTKTLRQNPTKTPKFSPGLQFFLEIPTYLGKNLKRCGNFRVSLNISRKISTDQNPAVSS